MKVYNVYWMADGYEDLNSVHRTFEGAKKTVNDHAKRLGIDLSVDYEMDGCWIYYVSKETDIVIQVMDLED